MLIQLVLMLVSLWGTPSSVSGGQPDESESKSDLKTVAQKLQPIFEKLDPKIKAELDERFGSYVVSYRTQKFTVHGIDKSGVISEQTRDAIGPSHQGFVLGINLEARGELHAIVTPQTRREPYWTTDYNLTRLKDSNKQIFWTLSYGSRTDEKLLQAIRDSVKKLGD